MRCSKENSEEDKALYSSRNECEYNTNVSEMHITSSHNLYLICRQK
jgi:hypothetical protein